MKIHERTECRKYELVMSFADLFVLKEQLENLTDKSPLSLQNLYDQLKDLTKD